MSAGTVLRVICNKKRLDYRDGFKKLGASDLNFL